MSEIMTVTYSTPSQAQDMAQVLARASMDHCGLEFNTDGNRLHIHAVSPLLAALVSATSSICNLFSRNGEGSAQPAGSAAH